MANNFTYRHLDPSATRVYKSAVLYGFEADDTCLLLLVKNGYVTEAPLFHRNKMRYTWIKGYHIDLLKNYFKSIRPLRWISPN